MLNLRIALTGTEIGMTRTGLLALAVTFSAGIHAALVPEHLNEMPPLGYAFIAAALIGGLIACALVSRPDDRRLPLLVPGFSGTPESIETIRPWLRDTRACASGTRSRRVRCTGT
jgi:hypothetical protein